MVKINELCGLEHISDCYYVSENGQIYNDKGNCKTQTLGKRGYYYVSLCRKHSNKNSKVPVHKILALAFIANRPYEVINHKDGNKLNNDVSNLEFCTQKENINHSWKKGLTIRLERLFKVEFRDYSYLVGTIKQLSQETDIPRGTLYDLYYKQKSSSKYDIVKIVEVTDNKG